MERPSSTFMENTIISTPKPISTSTVQRSRVRHRDLDQVPEKLSATKNESTDSLGILSIPSLNNSQVSNSSTFAMLELEHQRSLANDALQRASRVAAIPSRYLRPSEIPKSSTTTSKIFQDDSTISESDLLAGDNTSTPRCSGIGSSLGHSLARMSLSIQETGMSLHKFMEDFHSEFQNGSSMFQPASESKLMADEMSWKRLNDIPAKRTEFSMICSEDSSKVSVGSFFKMRSDDVSDLGIKSPQKPAEPVPLIDPDTSQIPRKTSDSLSLSTIQKILSETCNTPNRAIEIMAKFKPNPVKFDGDTSKESSDYIDEPTRALSFLSSVSSDCDKENIDCMQIQRASVSPDFDKSARSSRSASSLSSLPEGKLPIVSTQVELIWSCVKIGKRVSQEFVLRNKSAHRLRVQCRISGMAFKLKQQDENDSSLLIINFHPNETRAIGVTFAPIQSGAAVDAIDFTSVDPNHKQTERQLVRLYGYGGHEHLSIRNLIRHKSNGYLLALSGDYAEKEATFSLSNCGGLAAFAYFTFDPKRFAAFSSIRIEPKRLVLQPNEQKTVRVTYTPKKEDLKYLNGNSAVLEVGAIKMTSGSEVNRGRIRRLCRKAAEKGLEVDPLCARLAERFEGEAMPVDLRYLVERVGSMKELMQFLNCHEITITVEQDPDKTAVPVMADETSMFHTLTEDVSRLGLSETVVRAEETCKVEPAMIFLQPPNKCRDFVVISSSSGKVLHFEVTSSPAGLDLVPKFGELRPGQSVSVDVVMSEAFHDKTDFKILIYVENDVLSVDVKIFAARGRF